MFKKLVLSLSVAALSATVAAAAPLTGQWAEWNRPHEPFHIMGPIYDVGTQGFDVYLIKTQQGYVLIDGGLPESAPLIEANIKKLGLRLKDVRYIIIEHAHIDHAGGIAQLERDTEALVVAGEADIQALAAGQVDYGPSAGQHYPPVHPRWRVNDHDKLILGGLVMTAYATPGHTKGCMSWTARFWDKFHPYTAIFTCSITVAGNPIAGSAAYPRIAQDYRRTFATLRKIDADIVLAPHPNIWNRDAKLARVGGKENPFIDRGELRRLVDSSEQDFNTELAKQKAAQK